MNLPGVLKQIGFKDDEFIEHSNIIPGYIVDIFISSLNTAIDYNLFEFFTEAKGGKNSKYFITKLEACKKLNIRLIQIYEDEWKFKSNIVIARLKQLLYKNNDAIRIYARNCEVRVIDSKIKNDFVNKYHIQGKDSSCINLGLFLKGTSDLLAIITFGHGSLSKGRKNKSIGYNGRYELGRYVCDPKFHIPGAPSKLLSYFKKNYEWTELFTYADLRWSVGNLYEKLGFKLVSQTQSNYYYIIDGIRKHRFGFRKRPDEPKNITEWELRQKEGLDRIWDSGNLKFEMINDKK